MECSISEEIFKIAQSNPSKHKNMGGYHRVLSPTWIEIAHYLPSKLGKTLDIGCAYGTYTAFLARYASKVLACDVNEKTTKGMADVEWFNKQGIKFNFWNPETQICLPHYQDFDSIFMIEVIEHFSYSPVIPMQRVASALGKGGRLYLSTPTASTQNVDACTGRYCFYAHWRDIPEPWNGYQFEDAHHHIYSAQTLGQLIEECGLKVVSLMSISKSQHLLLIAEKE